MARIEIDPNYSSPTFSRATASTDLFKKEDVQALAAAISTHVHDGAGKGLAVAPGAATIPGSALTNGSVTLGKLAADSVDSSKIVDGTIATADLANASVTNAKLAADTARANLLTNGGFEIWQRGTGPFAIAAVWSADRWSTFGVGTDTLSISRDTTNINNSLAAAACTFTLGTGGGSTFVGQAPGRPGDGLEQLKNKTISFAIDVRCATASAVRVFISPDAGTTRTYSTYHTGGAAWERLTITLGLGLATDVRVGVAFAASTTAYLDNAMLVVGSQAADYAPLHPADDLARCLRYYEVWGSGTSGNSVGVGQAWSTTQASVSVQFRAVKPAAPTVTISANSDFQLESAAFAALALNGFSAVAPTVTGVDARPTVASGLVAGNATLFATSTSTARLIIESNP